VIELTTLAERMECLRPVEWTPLLRAARARAVPQSAVLEPGRRATVRVLAYRVVVAKVRGSWDLPYRLALVAIDGEETPRWISTERLIENEEPRGVPAPGAVTETKGPSR
jgi:hypothetical protein